MKKILLTLLGIVVVLGLFAAVGYAGYRYGYLQGAHTTPNGNMPQLRRFGDDELRGMPMHPFRFERSIHRGFGSGMLPFMSLGSFFALIWLGRILVLALIVWFIYWLFTRSGWRLTKAVPTAETQTGPMEIRPKE
jgi:hypothetical protein